MERQAVSTHYYYAHHPHPHQHYHDPALASLAYRPLQLPFEPLQQHPSPTELAPAAGSLNPRQQQQQQHHIPLRTTRQQAGQHARAMALYQGTTDEELAELQKLSNEYEPEVTVCPFCDVSLWCCGF